MSAQAAALQDGARDATVAVQLLDGLREFGVDRIFGVPGGAVGALYAALETRPDIRVVHAAHESGATFMALGYALATGRPGVVLTTAGPGITNAITGLASAYYESAPVVHIAGDVSRSAFGRGALQESSSHALDAVSMFKRFTKFSAQVSRPGSAGAVLRKALATAFSGRRGPVFLSLPLDVAAAPAVKQTILGGVRSSFDVDTNACRQAMEWLEGAERPLILVGSGARDFTSRRALRRLAEHVGAPVAVTTKAKGIFAEDHPQYLGIFGFGGHDSVTSYLAEGVDVILVCGSGLNDFSTNAWSPLLKARRAFIQIDVDTTQIGRNYPVDLGLLGPIDIVLSRMAEHQTQTPGGSRRPRPRPPASAVIRQPVEPSPRGMLTTAEVVTTMNEVCPANSLFTADMGEHLGVALHFLKVREEGDFLTCLGFGSMGSGICSAIGYQMGAPARRSFAICGDGGFLMMGNELARAAKHKVPTTFVVINDSRFNMVHHGQRDIYGSKLDYSLQEVDFAAVARGMGAEGIVITSLGDLRAALTKDLDGPLVLDVRVDPEVRLNGSQRLAALRQFTAGGQNA
jgi:acetolactate synthase-1/2/3 large subunit